MRRLTLLVAVLVAAACASPQPPPGGPVDEDSPQLTRIRPDSNATRVSLDGIGFEFDEVISERPQGSESLAELFLVSPSVGPNSVSWRRTRLEVKPKGGLRPNTTYTVVMLPGLTDLDGNVDTVGRTVVFSTGPQLAVGRVRGVVFDWLADRAAPRAFIEAIALPDSVHYFGFADSTGRYDLRNLPNGTFLVRALVDQNRNRELDPRELFDTATVAVGTTLINIVERSFHAIPRDTIGPGIERVEVVDSMTLRVALDRALDTAFVIRPGAFILKRGDSTAVPIASALGGRAVQRLRADSARIKAIQDSVQAVARADSARRADSVRTGRVPPPRPAPPPPAADTTPPPLKPTARIPDVEVFLTLEAPLPTGTAFRLRAEGLRSIVRAERSTERTFTTPRERPAAAPRDTGSTSPQSRR